MDIFETAQVRPLHHYRLDIYIGKTAQTHKSSRRPTTEVDIAQMTQNQTASPSLARRGGIRPPFPLRLAFLIRTPNYRRKTPTQSRRTSLCTAVVSAHQLSGQAKQNQQKKRKRKQPRVRRARGFYPPLPTGPLLTYPTEPSPSPDRTPHCPSLTSKHGRKIFRGGVKTSLTLSYCF